MRSWNLVLMGLVAVVGCSDLRGLGGMSSGGTVGSSATAPGAAIGLSTLGVVNVEVSKVSFQVAETECFRWAGQLAHWVEVGASIPSDARDVSYFKPAGDGVGTHFVPVGEASSATHVYYETPTYGLSAVSFSRGSSPATGHWPDADLETVLTSGVLGSAVGYRALFPAESSGNVVVTAGPGYVLGLRSASSGTGLGGSIGYRVQAATPTPGPTATPSATPAPSPTPPLVYEAVQRVTTNVVYLQSAATASIDVKVTELDGEAVEGLSREHFVVGGTPLQDLHATMAELGDGAYRLQVPTTRYEGYEREVSFVIQVVNKPGQATGRLYRTR